MKQSQSRLRRYCRGGWTALSQTMADRDPWQRLRAVMLDWACTTVDHISRAPVLALKTLLEQRGVQLADEQARRDMGLLKRDHIRAIPALP
jgi:phosphonoacetaldehyde hydrolase